MSLYTRDTAGGLIRIDINPGGTGADYVVVTNIPGGSGSPPREVGDYISRAMRIIGALDMGGTLTTDEYNEGLQAFNDMLDSWNTERLAIYTTQPYVFPLTAGTQTYTLGEGGDFNIPRPPRIERGVLRVTTIPDEPFDIPLHSYTDEEWAAIRLKSIGNTYPQGFWDDGAFPLRSINFWPIPDVNQSVVFYAWYALATATDVTDVVSFPPGYSRAVLYNLCVDLNEFGAIPPVVAAIAAESKAKIKSLNSANVVPLMACDPAVGGNKGTGYGYWAFLRGD